MVQFLIAAAGIVGLLLFWRIVMAILGYLIAWWSKFCRWLGGEEQPRVRARLETRSRATR